MNPTPESLSTLAREVATLEVNLQRLEDEIAEIGQPAAANLKHRLDALKIEENALKRNLSELLGMDQPAPHRLQQAEALLHYLQNEEAEAVHDADFLHQAALTSAEVQTRAATQIVNFCLRALRRVVGDHHPLGMSVFVNHNRKDLQDFYGLNRPLPPNQDTPAQPGA